MIFTRTARSGRFESLVQVSDFISGNTMREWRPNCASCIRKHAFCFYILLQYAISFVIDPLCVIYINSAFSSELQQDYNYILIMVIIICFLDNKNEMEDFVEFLNLIRVFFSTTYVGQVYVINY